MINTKKKGNKTTTQQKQYPHMHTKNAKPQHSILNSYTFTFPQNSNFNLSKKNFNFSV